MSGDLQQAVGERLAECRAILGGESSRLGRIWNARASRQDRRLLLALSGRRGMVWSRLADRSWQDVPPDVRAQVAAGMRRFKAWADEVCQ
jgi:hypothetical protein